MVVAWLCTERLIVVTQHQFGGFEMVLYILIVDRIIGKNIGPLFTTTTLIVAAAASALFLPYHSFIDSRLTKSITIFLVNKRNEINESKESNNSNLEINDPTIYEWLNDFINGINKKKCVVCDIGYCKVGEKDGGWWFMFVDMRSNDWYGSKWLNVDLPNRASIGNSEGWSFCYPCFGDIVSRSK